MIEFIELWNFQKHKHERIDFDPQCTTFIGENEAGKSTFIRALVWVMFNRPSGDEVMRHGAKRTKVTLGISGHLITRSRMGKANRYKLDGKLYHAFGTEVPEEIRKILNLSDVSIQEQLDGPFWLGLPPSQVSKELNRIVDLEVIDRSLSNVAGKMRRSRAKEQVLAEQMTTAKQLRKDTRWAKEFHTDLAGLNDLQKQIETDVNKRATLHDIVRNMANHEETRDRLLGAASDGQKLTGMIGKWREIQRQEQKLGELLDSAKAMEEGISKSRNQMEDSGEEIKRLLKGRCPICGTKLKGTVHGSGCNLVF